jgi:hypothetical protein
VAQLESGTPYFIAHDDDDFVESACIIPNTLELLNFLFRSAYSGASHGPTSPNRVLHRTRARTKACYQPVLQLQHVYARHLPACPPRLLLKRRCQQRPSRSPPSLPSLQTTPRHGRRTSALARRVNQVRASSRRPWSCSQTLSARWSS